MKSLAYTLLVLLGALTVAQAADKPKEEATIYAEEAAKEPSSDKDHATDAPAEEHKAN